VAVMPWSGQQTRPSSRQQTRSAASIAPWVTTCPVRSKFQRSKRRSTDASDARSPRVCRSIGRGSKSHFSRSVNGRVRRAINRRWRQRLMNRQRYASTALCWRQRQWTLTSCVRRHTTSVSIATPSEHCCATSWSDADVTVRRQATQRPTPRDQHRLLPRLHLLFHPSAQ
jgi:hypothetical protein